MKSGLVIVMAVFAIAILRQHAAACGSTKVGNKGLYLCGGDGKRHYFQ